MDWLDLRKKKYLNKTFNFSDLNNNLNEPQLYNLNENAYENGKHKVHVYFRMEKIDPTEKSTYSIKKKMKRIIAPAPAPVPAPAPQVEAEAPAPAPAPEAEAAYISEPTYYHYHTTAAAAAAASGPIVECNNNPLEMLKNQLVENLLSDIKEQILQSLEKELSKKREIKKVLSTDLATNYVLVEVNNKNQPCSSSSSRRSNKYSSGLQKNKQKKRSKSRKRQCSRPCCVVDSSISEEKYLREVHTGNIYQLKAVKKSKKKNSKNEEKEEEEEEENEEEKKDRKTKIKLSKNGVNGKRRNSAASESETSSQHTQPIEQKRVLKKKVSVSSRDQEEYYEKESSKASSTDDGEQREGEEGEQQQDEQSSSSQPTNSTPSSYKSKFNYFPKKKPHEADPSTDDSSPPEGKEADIMYNKLQHKDKLQIDGVKKMDEIRSLSRTRSNSDKLAFSNSIESTEEEELTDLSLHCLKSDKVNENNGKINNVDNERKVSRIPFHNVADMDKIKRLKEEGLINESIDESYNVAVARPEPAEYQLNRLMSLHPSTLNTDQFTDTSTLTTDTDQNQLQSAVLKQNNDDEAIVLQSSDLPPSNNPTSAVTNGSDESLKKKKKSSSAVKNNNKERVGVVTTTDEMQLDHSASNNSYPGCSTTTTTTSTTITTTKTITKTLNTTTATAMDQESVAASGNLSMARLLPLSIATPAFSASMGRDDQSSSDFHDRIIQTIDAYQSSTKVTILNDPNLQSNNSVKPRRQIHQSHKRKIS